MLQLSDIRCFRNKQPIHIKVEQHLEVNENTYKSIKMSESVSGVTHYK